MRVVAQIENPYFTVTIHQYNDKYIVKLEGGPMDQTYKFPTDSFRNVEQVKQLVDEQFTQNSVEIHKQMMENYKLCVARIKEDFNS